MKAYEEIKRLSEKLMIPVATTVKAKGAFPEDHLLSLGVFGFVLGGTLAAIYGGILIVMYLGPPANPANRRKAES